MADPIEIDSGEESDYYDATLFPVFVTADVGLDLVNACLTKSATFTSNAGLDGLQALYLITDALAPHPVGPMDLPISSFTSPFLNHTVEQLMDIFDSHVSQREDAEHDLMAGSIFMVLDERSARDNTLRVVQVGEREDDSATGEEGELVVANSARCEFEIAAIYAMGPEQGTMELGEGEEGFGTREVVVTRERFERLMEEGDEMDEDDDEGFEYEDDEDEG